MATLDKRFPSIDDMEKAALRRIPYFASEYLRGGIGRETCLARNRDALDQVLFDPRYPVPVQPGEADPAKEIFGQTYDLPFGIGPLGMSGLMWPGAVQILAHAAVDANIPMVMSQFATTHMTDFRSITGLNGWYQLYTPHDPAMRDTMLAEITATGFDVLVVTIDIPATTRRDRELRIGLSVPPKLSFCTFWDAAMHPHWALATLIEGVPEFQNVLPHFPKDLSLAQKATFLADLLKSHVTPDTLRAIRNRWPGKLLVKGILTLDDAKTALDCGADGIWVSNHGARQLDALMEWTPKVRQIN